MKVLILYQNIDSGAKIATEALVRELKKINKKATILTYVQQPNHYLGAFSFLRNTIWSIRDYWKEVNEHEDISVIYSSIYTGVIGAHLARRGPIVFHIHGDQGFKSKPFSLTTIFQYLYHQLVGQLVIQLQVWAVKLATYIIFVSESAKDSFLGSYYLNNEKGKIVIIPNGVSALFFNRVSHKDRMRMRRELEISKRKILAYIGRIDEKKGIHLLLEACHLLNDPPHLLIIYPKFTDTYSSTYLGQLKKQAKLYNLSVLFIVDPPHVNQYYSLADGIILPSQQEMMPLVMLEALASGTPFLGTKINGMYEILPKVSSKLLLESLQPAYLAKKIEETLSLGQSERQKLGTQSRRVARTLTWKKSADKLNALLLQVIQP